ncbi:unnamed protein product [Ixodes persulcatus]
MLHFVGYRPIHTCTTALLVGAGNRADLAEAALTSRALIKRCTSVKLRSGQCCISTVPSVDLALRCMCDPVLRMLKQVMWYLCCASSNLIACGIVVLLLLNLCCHSNSRRLLSPGKYLNKCFHSWNTQRLMRALRESVGHADVSNVLSPLSP